MHPHAALIERFYQAFQKKDHATMAACYHPDILFSDPVFTDLRGFRAGAMWHMLTERGKDLTLVYSGIEADDQEGKAHWEADYTFSGTGRKVHNVIDAHFKFKDGKIVEHRDHFDLSLWTRMALGPSGYLLGWSSFLQNKVRGQASKGLEDFINKRGLS